MGKNFESTPAYRKGLIGEEIVKKYLESHGQIVRRSDDTSKSGASIVDFVVEQIIDDPDPDKIWTYTEFAEVKVKSPIMYAYRFPAYMFPKTQIELYKRYSKEKDIEVILHIVDEQRESIFACDMQSLDEAEFRIEDKIFPLDVEQSDGNGMFRVYSIEQFWESAKIDFTDLERLRSIKFPSGEKKYLKLLQNSPADISDEELILDSREIVRQYLELDLPKGLPSKAKKISALVKSLRPKLNRIPTCFFYEIYHAVHNINMNYQIQAFVDAFYPLLDEIRHERQKASYEPPEIIEIETAVKKVAELRAPNNTLLGIFEVDGNNPRFFIKLKHDGLRPALGQPIFGAFHTSVGNSIKAVSHFYSLQEISKYANGIAVAVKDVSSIVSEYVFNRADEISDYETATEFLTWWNEAAEPYFEAPLAEKISFTIEFTAEHVQEIVKLADSITEILHVTKEDALRSAIKIKFDELHADLTQLVNLMK